MSNYRSNYGRRSAGKMTPRQWRRFDRKFWRDEHLALVEGLQPGNVNPRASLSGHPGRRRAQLGGRAPLRGSIERYVAIHDPDGRPRRGHSHQFAVVSRAAYLAQSGRSV